MIGVHQDGGFSEHLCVPVSNLLMVDDIDPEVVALVRPFAISAHAVRRAAIRAGEQVPVAGTGSTGLGTAAVAKADGAQVIVADTSPTRCDHVAQHLSLTTPDPSDPPFTEQLSATFGDSLAQKVIDATGNQQAVNSTVNLIRHGGSIIFIGLSKGELQFSGPEFHKEETTIMGSRSATGENLTKVRRLMAKGKIIARMMLIHHYDFRPLADTYEGGMVSNRQLIRGVIHLQQVSL